MSDYNRINPAELDRHITGNYGEDQFRSQPVTILGVTFTPKPDCDNCDGSGVFAEDDQGNPTELCHFCLEDAIKRGEVDGEVTA